MHYFGEIVLAEVQYTDSNEAKKRPVLVLFEELGNIVVAGITSNPEMKGIPLAKGEGMLNDSVIKLNYIFTISSKSILKQFFTISENKKKMFKEELMNKLN
ncbi:MAG: type II toxin-antitoxin system PemK/MazF family toxin [Nanoarchaeota archaeon]